MKRLIFTLLTLLAFALLAPAAFAGPMDDDNLGDTDVLPAAASASATTQPSSGGIRRLPEPASELWDELRDAKAKLRKVELRDARADGHAEGQQNFIVLFSAVILGFLCFMGLAFAFLRLSGRIQGLQTEIKKLREGQMESKPAESPTKSDEQ